MTLGIDSNDFGSSLVVSNFPVESPAGESSVESSVVESPVKSSKSSKIGVILSYGKSTGNPLAF